MLIMEDRLLTIGEVAQFFSMHEESIARLFRQGKVPGAFKFGGEWRISQHDLETYIEQQKKKQQDKKQ